MLLSVATSRRLSSLSSLLHRSGECDLLLPPSPAMPSINYATASQRDDVESESKLAAKIEHEVKERIHDLLVHHPHPHNTLAPLSDQPHHYTPPSPLPLLDDDDDFHDDPSFHLPNQGWHPASPPSSLHPSSSSSSLPSPSLTSSRRLMHVAFVALRRNLIPGLILQAFALLLLILYFSSNTVQAAFDAVAAVKDTYGFLFSAVVSGIAGGVIPFLLLAWQYKKEEQRKVAEGKVVPPRNPLLQWEAAVLIGLWAYKGVEVDAFYSLQGVMFGNSNSAAVVVPKVLVDM